MGESLDVEVSAVVSRAQFLQEKLARSGQDPSSAVDHELREAWVDAVEPAGTAWFAKRLEWQRLLDPDDGVTAGDHEWGARLGDICRAAQDGATLEPSPWRGEDPIAFEDLLAPAIVVARRQLLGRMGAMDSVRSLSEHLEDSAYLDLERALCQQLLQLAGKALDHVLARARPPGRALLLGLGLNGGGPPGREQYDEFVRRHLDSGLLDLFEEFPVLGRLMATAVVHWVDATCELLQHIRLDWECLVGELGVTRTSKVVAIRTGLGDRHRGGRTVSRLVMCDGRSVVYKPRSLAMEAEFNRLVGWTNSVASTGPGLRALTVVDCGDHGWCEYVAPRPCAEGEGAATFFERAGRLLCLLHVLRATDCHFENVVAAGDHPVLVDAETLLYPDPRPLFGEDEGPGTGPLVDPLVAGSVLRVGLLPRWQIAGRSAFDNSGLGGPSRRGGGSVPLVWVDVDSDDLRLVPGTPDPDEAVNLPVAGGVTASVFEHEDSLVQGFSDMYQLLQGRAGELVAPGRPLALMRTAQARFIQRSTRVYGQLLDALLEPTSLVGGAEAGLQLERLATAYLAAPDAPRAWRAFAAEVRGLSRFDVPLFETRPDSLDLWSSDGSVIEEAFEVPGHDAVVARIEALDDRDLAKQVRVIRMTVAARRDVALTRPPGRVVRSRPAETHADELVQGAVELATRLEADALPDGRDSVTWLGVRHRAEADCLETGVIDDFLYDGRAGLGVFFGALFATTGEARWQRLALAALAGPRARLRQVASDGRPLAARLHGLGGTSGLGGLLHSLTLAGSFLDHESHRDLHADAAELAGWFTPSLVSGDANLDVVGGTAGALLALAALHDRTGIAEARTGVAACATHLVEQRTGARPRAWRTVAPRRLAGFGHGAAGICYALTRAHTITGEASFLDAALEGVEFERRLFDSRHSAWPDRRPVELRADGRWPARWCHGAAGIVLGRLGMMTEPGASPVDALEEEIRAGLVAVEQQYGTGWDTMCCGLAGRVEAFTVAAQRLDDPGYADLAAAGAAVLLEGVREGLRLPALRNSRPGMFQGVSGIGYQLLRVADPGLPSVLLLA